MRVGGSHDLLDQIQRIDFVVGQVENLDGRARLEHGDDHGEDAAVARRDGLAHHLGWIRGDVAAGDDEAELAEHRVDVEAFSSERMKANQEEKTQSGADCSDGASEDDS